MRIPFTSPPNLSLICPLTMEIYYRTGITGNTDRQSDRQTRTHTYTNIQREREREREGETDRQRERQRERKRETERLNLIVILSPYRLVSIQGRVIS